MAVTDSIIIRHLGLRPYEPVFHAMQAFTDKRTQETRDEIWLLEHEPVFTLGLAANRAHLLDPHAIPVIQADRGGEITYHGPGQAVVYFLLDLKRRMKNRLLIREFVRDIEQTVIDTLATYHLFSERRAGAPGIYLRQDYPDSQWQGAKIAALGLKVKSNGCVYHGFSLNVAMDLQPFSWINPCGYAGLATVDMKTAGVHVPLMDVQHVLVDALCRQMKAQADFSDKGLSFNP